MKEKRVLTPLELQLLQDFTKAHASCIYEYINREVLHGIGVMSLEYFVKAIHDIFIRKINLEIEIETVNSNLFPYILLILSSYNGKIDYTSSRVETIDFTQINKEASTYYNYVRFSLKNDIFAIELMQTKIGGMPIDEDIVKFKKEIVVKSSGLEAFIAQKKQEINKIELNEQYKTINETIESILA